MNKIIGAIFVCLALTSCDTEKSVLCDKPIQTTGSLEVVNRQCIMFNDHVVAFLELKNKSSGKHYFYHLNWINGHIVMNLTTEQALQLEETENAEMMATIAATTAATSAMYASRR